MFINSPAYFIDELEKNDLIKPKISLTVKILNIFDCKNFKGWVIGLYIPKATLEEELDSNWSIKTNVFPGCRNNAIKNDFKMIIYKKIVYMFINIKKFKF